MCPRDALAIRVARSCRAVRVIAVLSAALTAVIVGCVPGWAAGASALEIVDYRQSGDAARYRETFEEGYFDIDEYGNVDIVLRRATPPSGEAPQNITQMVHIKSVWRVIPGTTVAHKTQLNATIRYHILAGQTGAAFEGAGSVFFDVDGSKSALAGTLGLVVLHPRQRLATDAQVFRRAELQGRFKASRDPRRVVRIVNEMNRQFGPPTAPRPGREQP